MTKIIAITRKFNLVSRFLAILPPPPSFFFLLSSSSFFLLPILFLLPSSYPPSLSSSYSRPLSPSSFLTKIGLGDTGHGWGAGFKHEVAPFLPSTIDYKFIFPTALVQPVCCY